MIIQCENCEARFRLDDEKVPEKGRKVRCSKCKHVFVARKTPPPPPDELEFQIDEDELAQMGPEEAARTQPPPVPPQEQEDIFEPTVKIDLSSQEELTFDEEQDEFGLGEEEAAPPPVPRRGGLGRAFLWVALLVVILVGTGVLLGQLGLLPVPAGLEIPFLTSPAEAPTANLIIDQSRLEGKWEKNAHVPRIFIIQGSLENRSKKPRIRVKVRGFLIDNAGKPLKSTWSYSGNRIPDDDLRTKAPAEIQKRLRIPNRIAPGTSTPFTLVFFDVPPGAESYGAEILQAVIPGSS